jgi:hypothetical protein
MSSFSFSRALSRLRGNSVSRPRSNAINSTVQRAPNSSAAAASPASSKPKKKRSIHKINASLIPLSERIGVTPLHLRVNTHGRSKARVERNKKISFNHYQMEVPFRKTNISRVVAHTERERVLRKNLRNREELPQNRSGRNSSSRSGKSGNR